MKKILLMVCLSLASGIARAELPQGVYQLSSFGPVKTEAESQKTLDIAVQKISGGGILLIDQQVAAAFEPNSLPQKQLGVPGVFMVDIRQGKLRMIPPSLGFRQKESPSGYSAYFLDRTINQDGMNIHGLNTIMRISDRILKGTTSYYQYTEKYEKMDDPETVKIYVPTIKGLYVGAELFVQMGSESVEYSEKKFSTQIVARIEKLGLDETTNRFYIIMRKKDPKATWGKILGLFNKASANSLMITETNHTDQENFGTVTIDKHAYGQGDNFGVGVNYSYMGNIMSTRADECGNAFTANIWHVLRPFIGKVEKYDAETGKLQFDTAAANANTLGTSRPLINLNPAKWITKGKIAIEAKFSEYGEVDPKGYVRGIDTGWTAEITGRYLAVDEPEEYAGNPPQGFWKGALKERKIRRWWYITHYEKVSGEDRLWIERTRYEIFDRAAPTLINEQSYRKPLSYIIAPGAMVADVSRGVPEVDKHLTKSLSEPPGKSRIIMLAPSKDKENTFAVGDLIEQSVGSDPAHPNGYRVRHREAMPSGLANSCSFYSINNGAYPVRAALGVYGAHDKMQIPHHNKFFNIIDVGTTCDYGIRFRNTVKNAALYLERADHKIVWKTPKGKVTLSAGDTALNLNASGISKVQSISTTETTGQNLRGVNITVPVGQKQFEYRFAKPEPDAAYSLTVQPNWLCRWAVTAKTPQGFTVVFDEAAGSKSTLDWQLIR